LLIEFSPSQSVTLESVLVDEATHEVYHVELRPSGRSMLVKSKDEKDVVDQDWNVRTRVFEYGGSAATVSNGIAYFSHYGDGSVPR